MRDVLCYAIGSGLGHLAFTRRMIELRGWQDRATIVTASEYARDQRVTGGLPARVVPRELHEDPPGLAAWLTEVLVELRPRTMLVDAFPAGILGELCKLDALEGIELQHVARLLRWDVYAQRVRGELPRYALTSVVEPLHRPHVEAISRASARMEWLELPDDDAPPDEGLAATARVRELQARGTPVWLVAHSSPRFEVEALVKGAVATRAHEASQAALLVATREPPEALPDFAEVIDAFPIRPLFGLVDRVFSGCGLNTMLELRRFRDKHWFLPLDRPLDDQQQRYRTATQRRVTVRIPPLPAR